MTKEKWKLTPAAFRRGVNWLLFLAIFHLAGRILYGAFFNGSVKVMFDKDEDYARAFGTVLVFQLIFWLIVALLYIWRAVMSFSDVQREMKNATKEEDFNPNRYFRNTFLRDWIWRTALYAVFQIPFFIFHASYGLNLGNAMTGFEAYYIADAGFYGTCGTALGFLLTTLYFFGIMVLVHYVVYRAMLIKQNKF